MGDPNALHFDASTLTENLPVLRHLRQTQDGRQCTVFEMLIANASLLGLGVM